MAALIRARLAGDTLPPFRYKHAGGLAQIGKRPAVIDFGWIKLSGTLAWWIWGLAHIYFLIGLRNRLSVALSWLWIYVRDQRSARLITQGAARSRDRFARWHGPAARQAAHGLIWVDAPAIPAIVARPRAKYAGQTLA